ncbi:MAG: hypothetical protein MPN21_27465 [Thermoanaerobaculia bacterium]|nr:hypothetical protein [Thermoanaerobaculia bacterium]
MRKRKLTMTVAEKVRQIRIKVHRAQDVLEDVQADFSEAKEMAEDLGTAGVDFRRTMKAVLKEFDAVTCKPSHAADDLENSALSAGPDQLTATELIVGGGEVPEPDAHALGQLLDLVEGGSSEALDFENELSKRAFVWLLRQHPPAVDQIRRLAKLAGVVNSDHIKWAGKRV